MAVGGQIREWSGDALRKKFPEDQVDIFEAKRVCWVDRAAWKALRRHDGSGEAVRPLGAGQPCAMVPADCGGLSVGVWSWALDLGDVKTHMANGYRSLSASY